jgi:hypothetical protein
MYRRSWLARHALGIRVIPMHPEIAYAVPVKPDSARIGAARRYVLESPSSNENVILA